MLACPRHVVGQLLVSCHRASSSPRTVIDTFLVGARFHTLLALPLGIVKDKGRCPLHVLALGVGDLVNQKRHAVKQTRPLLHCNRRSTLACAVAQGVTPDACLGT